MPEFYVTYRRDGNSVLAVVRARTRSEQLMYSSYDELQSVMNSLDPTWQVHSETVLPAELAATISARWLEESARIKAMHNELPPPDSVFSYGSIPNGC
jgi:hypothetical protein